MISSWLHRLVLFSRRLVVRIVLIAVLSLLSILLAKLAGRFIPPGAEGIVGAEAVDHLLAILANSMLTITTFSLAVMAATHRAVAGLWTPRAHQILLQDTTTHTVLATFVGAYLYAVIAIILRETEVFQSEELLILFAMTILVLVLVLAAVIRWILHLEVFGSLIGTAQRIEAQTLKAWKGRSEAPALGAQLLVETEIPAGAKMFRAGTSGYIKHIFSERLQEAAEEAEGRIWLLQDVGTFVYQGDVLARFEGAEELEEAIAPNIEVGTLRDYPQDPGFGLLTLSEMASRALSPGVNDPGTAIDAAQRIVRILLACSETPPNDVQHDRLWMPPLDPDAMLHRAIKPLIRDGADRPEVQAALDRALQALGRHAWPALARSATALRRELPGPKEDGFAGG